MLQPIPSKPEADPAEILHLDQSDKGSLFRIWRKGCLQYSHQNPAEVAEFLMGRICAYLAGHSRQGLVFHAAAVSRAGRGIMLAGHSRQGLVFHTAAVSRAGRGIMLAGPTGAGKSTLTAYLLDGGYGCLSDELVFIRQGVLEFEALSRPTSLKVVCRRLSGADAGLQLMQCAVNARNLADHGLAEIGRLARAVSAYRLTYGELSQAAAALEVI